MSVIINKNDTLEQAIAKINKEIDSRRSYGVRTEQVPSKQKVYKLDWYNGPAEWSPTRPDEALKCQCEPGTDVSTEVKMINSPWCKEKETGISWEQKADCWDKIRKATGAETGMERPSSPIKPVKGKKAPCRCSHVVHDTQCLDANQILVVGLTHKVLREMAPLLHQLPLYAGSYEARERGVFDISGIEIPPGLKKAWVESEMGGEPLDIQSQIALEKKRQEN